jgi:hypothetical protein
MAGDWIPMRTDLFDDPAVITIASSCGLDEYAVVGKLLRLWSWANRHLATGNALGVTVSWIDRYVGTAGFAAAMLNAGWLRTRSDGVEFPNFERWNSQGAKRRVLTAQRVAGHKARGNAETNAKGNAPSVSDALPKEEKRRVERNTEDPLTPASGGKRRRKPKLIEELESDPGFVRFWQAYPKKADKPAAARVFAKLNPSQELLDKILEKLEAFKRSDGWTKDDGKFIKNASGWLNGRRWEDEPPVVTSPPTSPSHRSHAPPKSPTQARIDALIDTLTDELQ